MTYILIVGPLWKFMGLDLEQKVADSTEKTTKKSLPKKIFHKFLQAALGFHLFTQANYCVRGNQDSEQRKVFEQEFGFPVQGFPQNVEGTEGNLSKIAAAVHKEKLEKPFDMSAIRVSSDNYLQKSIFGQLEYIIIKGGEAYDGINYPFMGRIYLDDHFGGSTVNHEIKHAKTDYVIQHDPLFLLRWLELTRDDKGDSLYSGYGSWVLSRVRLIGDFIDVDYPSSEENKELGFTSSYSRIHYYEDIAVLSEQAESNYYVDDFVEYLYTKKNEKVIAKVNLLQDYGMIPKEFTEYIAIRKAFDEQQLEQSPLEEVFTVSGNFLEKYPKTVYEINFRKIRGDLLESEGACEEAIPEYKSGLTSVYKHPDVYPLLLKNISDCYDELLDHQRASLYQEAKEKYGRGWKGNNVKIAIHGVNDFLIENGEDLK